LSTFTLNFKIHPGQERRYFPDSRLQVFHFFRQLFPGHQIGRSLFTDILRAFGEFPSLADPFIQPADMFQDCQFSISSSENSNGLESQSIWGIISH
jgi:hypothetical protein